MTASTIPIGFASMNGHSNPIPIPKPPAPIAIRQRPMLAIPYIVTEDEVLVRRRLLKRAVIVTTVVIATAAILTHLFYKPLDILILKIIERFA